jgi:carbon starvation protein
MSLVAIVLVSAAVLGLAYRVYGAWLVRLFRLDPQAPTPAQELKDDQDYIPTDPKFLIGQHFSAIAAAGPIVGPILAGLAFGWLPALLWILVGSALVGGVHDFGALVASVRHRARSIAEVVRDNMSRRSHLLFLSFIWIALVYIVVAFADLTAASFVGRQTLESGETVSGAGIATASALYLLIPMAMGLALKRGGMGLWPATALFLPLVLGSVWLGQALPLDLGAWLGIGDAGAQRVWVVVILGYCLVAAVLPMWLLLQPRGHLGGMLLYIAIAAGVVGVLFGGKTVEYPAFLGWTSAAGQSLAPFLFITVACGACSGFHSLIATGTTSKQLRREPDARPVAYGSMLMEAMVAVIALSCVMVLAQGSDLTKAPPNVVYASGIAGFLQVFGIPAAFALSLALMAFTTFVYDTLDVCTRLGRYIVQELTGWRGRGGAWLGTALTAGVPVFFVFSTATGADGRPMPAWRVFWSLFGASNQLLAALALLGVTVWLWRTRRQAWVLLVCGLPTVFMYAMSSWALVSLVVEGLRPGAPSAAVPVVAVVLLGLAAWMLVEGVAAFFSPPPARLARSAASA